MDKKIALQEERPCLLLDVHLSVNYARDLLPGLSLLLLLLSLSLKCDSTVQFLAVKMVQQLVSADTWTRPFPFQKN